ncbi:hypothetical protein [Limnoglobus roseus]|uniref:TIGR03067 domain-containing protein n=1 Tax=Limnoglobus roseus TaxID=2598579 RepID=A0A5C1A9D0_9BACT|nr:hypothetical protein [Limnoglobus roseus]QEL15330.1 hypothetical protein PX52LOC_02245 [Limnoglobus roseus]
MIRSLAVAFALLAASPAFAQDSPVAGSWSGYWISDTSGHRGPLRATVRPVDGGSAYRATYRGRFAAVIPFRYSMTMNVVGSDGGTTYLAGEQRLPLFGTFRYSATVTDADFVSSFDARRDRGRFVMTRTGR